MLARFVITAATAVTLAVITAAGTAAAMTETWTTPVSELAAAGQNPYIPDALRSDAAGNVTALWPQAIGGYYVMQTADLPAGGSWSAATALSAGGATAYAGQLAVNPRGDAVAIWTHSNGTHFIVQIIERPAGGSWGAVTDLSAVGQSALNPQVAINSNGDIAAVWSRNNGTHTIVQSARKISGSTWSAPADLSAIGASASNLQIALSSTGVAIATWERSDGTNTRIQSAEFANGTWGPPLNLSASGRNATNAKLVIDDSETATAVWQRSNGTHTIIQSVSKANGGSWTNPVDLSAAGGNATGANIAIGITTAPTAVWLRNDGANNIVQTSSLTASGTWSAPMSLSVSGRHAYEPRLAISNSGIATVVWSLYDGTIYKVQASTRLNGVSWNTPTDLSMANRDGYSALIAAGDEATVLWNQDNGTYGRYVSRTSVTTWALQYDANGGTGTIPSSQSSTLGTSISAANGSGLAKSGLTFAGWNTAANGSGVSYAAGASVTPSTDMKLYAQWSTSGTNTASPGASSGAASTQSLAATGFESGAIVAGVFASIVGVAALMWSRRSTMR